MRPGLEAVYCNARTGFTLQLPVIIAAVTPEDDDEVFTAKAALIAGALEIFIVRRMVNYRNFGYSTVVYTMFNLIKDVRDQPIEIVRSVLTRWLETEQERLDGIQRFGLTQRNRSHIHYLLARITAWLDSELGTGTSLADYLDRSRTHPYEVEHIWANKYERHADEFPTAYEFEEHRNKIGDLLLLPKDFNASYGAMPYEEKYEHYFGQNPLAKSLHPLAYENHPQLRPPPQDPQSLVRAVPDEIRQGRHRRPSGSVPRAGGDRLESSPNRAHLRLSVHRTQAVPGDGCSAPVG